MKYFRPAYVVTYFSNAVLGRSGDFKVGDTAFHVTISPMTGIFTKCKRNVEEGLRVYLLVPDSWVASVRLSANEVAPGKISVESIESFVSQNIDELSTFSQEKLANEFYQLLRIYNERVDSAEIDKSMIIEIPRNLHR